MLVDAFSQSDSFLYNDYNNHEKSGFNITKNDILTDSNEPNDDLILKVLTDCINQQSEKEINEHINELTTEEALHDYFKMFAIADSTTNPYTDYYSDNNIISRDGRISLAYENLHNIPQKIAENFSNDIKCLDLSFNKFKDLSFLSIFKGLNTLILDKNSEPDETSLPYLTNLQILWLNNCNIINIPKWIFRIKMQCPNIKQLSLIGNPGARTLLTGANSNEENEYRLYVTEILKTLTHLDGIPVISTSSASLSTNMSSTGVTSSIYCGTPPLITFASSTITGNCNEISLQSLLHNQTSTIQSKTTKSKQQQLCNSNASILLKNNSINSTIIPSHTGGGGGAGGAGSKLSSSTSIKSYYFHNNQQQYHQQQQYNQQQQRKKINYNEKDNHNLNNNNNNNNNNNYMSSINNINSQNKKKKILTSSFKDMFRFNVQRRKSCQSSTTS